MDYTQQKPNVGPACAHRRGRWANVESTMGERLEFAE